MQQELCMNCMREIGDASVCPHCGFSVESPQIAPYLPFETLLADRYYIGKMLSAGGDGATYMAFDTVRKSPVTVREFLPEGHIARVQGETQVSVLRGSELLYRDGMTEFLDLWRTLARMRALTALVPVLDIVEENGTAYAVSELLETISLREFLLKSRTGYLGFEQTKALLMPVVSTLSKLHELGIIHGGISPTALRLGRDGKIRLTDFMITPAHIQNSGYASELAAGYAPIEQYSNAGSIGSWTDVYAFAAVTYRMLIGSTPEDAPTRAANDKLMIPAKFVESLPAYVISALQNALAISPDDRTETIDLYREELSGSPTVMAARKTAAQAAVQAKTTEEEAAERLRKEKLRKEMLRKQEQTRILLISFGVCLAVGLLLLGGYFFFTRDKAPQADITAPSEQTELVDVPNFAGQSYTRIKSDAVLNARFHFVVEYAFSDTVESEYIISQGIEEGQRVPMGSDLKIVVSKGVEMVTLPDVSGMKYENAVQTLLNAGFTCTKVEKENDGTHTAGIVIGTTPQSGKEYAKGKEIFVEVWAQPPTTQPSGIGGLIPNIFG